MIWLPKSIMHTRGVAGGKVGQTHELSEDRQGEFQYTIGPYADPVLQIEPGDRIIVETVDTFGGAIRTEVDLPTQKLCAPFLNPQSGPIVVGGATGFLFGFAKRWSYGLVLLLHAASIISS
jgi:amidase